MDKHQLIVTMADIQTNYDCGFITIEEYISQNKVVIDLYYVNSPNAYYKSSSVNTITQKELQIIFDDNGLDSYCVYSIGLNHGANGDVIIDSDLIDYLGAFHVWLDIYTNHLVLSSNKHILCMRTLVLCRLEITVQICTRLLIVGKSGCITVAS